MKTALLATLLLLPHTAGAAPSTSPAPAPRSAAALSGSDAEFLAARNAFRSGDTALVDRLYPRLASSLLEPYVAY